MEWSIIAIAGGAPSYRTNYVGTHAVMLNAIGLATYHLLTRFSVEEISALLKHNEVDSREAFSFAHWENRCIDQMTWKLLTNATAVKLTASKLLQMLQIVLPEEFQKLEIDYFNASPESFRKEDGFDKAYEFSADSEAAWSQTVWSEHIERIYADANATDSTTISEVDILSKILCAIEEFSPLPMTHDELLKRLKIAVIKDRGQLIFKLKSSGMKYLEKDFRYDTRDYQDSAKVFACENSPQGEAHA